MNTKRFLRIASSSDTEELSEFLVIDVFLLMVAGLTLPAHANDSLLRIHGTSALSPCASSTVAYGTPSAIVGSSPQMTELRAQIARVAPLDLTVLITGESGSGKEVVAQEIHRLSTRANRKMQALNCAAVPESLMQSELFGHEKGSFTGAVARKGLLEAADGGSLFLDEIGDMPPALQAAILRALETRTFTRVGGNTTYESDFRLISATNINFATALREKKFREDLFWRLSVVTIHVPPLREHVEDLPELIAHFTAAIHKEHGLAAKSVSLELLEQMKDYAWPGNVRELKHFLTAALALGNGAMLIPADLKRHRRLVPNITVTSAVQSLSELPSPDEIVRELLTESLRRSRGDVAHAAREIGIHPTEFRRRAATLLLPLPNP